MSQKNNIFSVKFLILLIIIISLGFITVVNVSFETEMVAEIVGVKTGEKCCLLDVKIEGNEKIGVYFFKYNGSDPRRKEVTKTGLWIAECSKQKEGDKITLRGKRKINGDYILEWNGVNGNSFEL